MAVIPVHVVPLTGGKFAFRYINYAVGKVKLTNEELYEGNIRSDFSTFRARPTYDSVSVVRI